MSYKKGQKVKISDVEATEKDELMDKEALEIIKKSNFTGNITKIVDGIHFVGFKNDLGWVTQGFKNDEIQEAK